MAVSKPKKPKNEAKVNKVEGISLADAVQIKRPKRKVITGNPKK